MLRKVLIVMIGVIVLAGCQKKQAAGTATAGRSPALTADRAVYESPVQQAQDANPFMEGAASGAAAMAQPGSPAADKSSNLAEFAKQATPEQTAKVRKTLLETAKRHGFAVDESGKTMSSKSMKLSGIDVERSVERVVGKMVEQKATFDDKMVMSYTEQFMASFAQAMALKQEEKSKVLTPQGGQVEVINQAQPLDLKPGGTVAGEWQSLREVSKNNVYTVNHNNAYHDLLTLKRNGTLTWVRFRGGQEFSNEQYKYRYDKNGGALTLLDAKSGKETQTLKVYTIEGEPDSIYIETPGMERLTVFGPLGGK